MKLGLANSPEKPVLLLAICCLIMGLIFLIPGGRLVHSPLFGTYLIFCIVTVPICTVLPFKFVTDLRHGIENEDWTEEQLEPLRAHLESRYYAALGISLPAALFVSDLLLNRRFGDQGDMGAAWLSFVYMLLYQLRIILKRPPSSTPPIDGHDDAPIHSDH